MTTISQTITTLPPAPLRSDPDTFADKGEAFLTALENLPGELNNYAGEANAVAGEINTARSDVVSYKDIAAAAANFKGNWTSLTGELSVPASVYHNGTFYQLLTDIPDVTQKIPGTDPEWAAAILLPDQTGKSGYFLQSENGALKWSDILAYLKTIDGAGSGLDADLLDGHEGSYYADTATLENKIGWIENNLILESFRRMIGDIQLGADSFDNGWTDELNDDTNITLINGTYDATNHLIHSIDPIFLESFGTNGTNGWSFNSSYINETRYSDYTMYNVHGGYATPDTSISHAGVSLDGSDINVVCNMGVNIGNAYDPDGNPYNHIRFQFLAGLPSIMIRYDNAFSIAGTWYTPSVSNWLNFEAKFVVHYSAGTADFYIDGTYITQVSFDNSATMSNIEFKMSYEGSPHNYLYLHNLYFIKEIYPENITVSFDSFAVSTEPIKSKGLFIIQTNDTGTDGIQTIALNTDLKAYFSNDDGTTWQEATLEDVGAFETNQRIIVGTATMTATGQKTTKMKLQTFNNKYIKLYSAANFLHD